MVRNLLLITLGIALSFGSSTPDSSGFPLWIMVICSAAISLGTILGGKRIIKSVGMDMVKLEKYQGCAANFSTTFTLLVASLTGMPVSTGHCNTSAIMGVGRRNRSSANWFIAKNMLMAWIITFRHAVLSIFACENLHDVRQLQLRGLIKGSI